MQDLIEKEKSLRAFQSGVWLRLLRHMLSAVVVFAVAVAAFAAYVFAGAHSAAISQGTIRGLAVRANAVVYRDARGIPHIRARYERDAFFAEGFAQASDRLFQMDLLRRYVYGRLAEVLGPIQLSQDEQMRVLDVHDIVRREWRALPIRDRTALQSFSDGVNAAIARQPLPVEFRLLIYRPERWTPADSLAVTLAISASLGDTAENVVRRDILWRSMGRDRFAQLLPLSDARYDVPAGTARPVRHVVWPTLAWARLHRIGISGAGSNAWAAGAQRTTGGHALIANDPHLRVGIPGLWYALEMRAGTFHAAGVTIPGIPGIVLGHNERIAWASTNAIVTTLSLFRPRAFFHRYWQTERFHVRFGKDVLKRYYRTAREFGGDGAAQGTLVRWRPYYDSRSAISTVLDLDRATGIEGALRALAHYSGPPQNFAIADADGRVAYHLAGEIPDDPAWGRYVHPARDLGRSFAAIPFDRLPGTAPSKRAIVISANNKMYAAGYPYRLSAMFAPPYRAYRIAQLLHARTLYGVRYFARMQLDTLSPMDAEVAHRVAAISRKHPALLSAPDALLLREWDGSFSPGSRAATIEHRFRSAAENEALSPYSALDTLREAPPQRLVQMLRDAGTPADAPWGLAGRIDVLHPFGPIGFPFLDGGPLPGNGDEYTVRVQTQTISQSFRAVWEAGNWDAGGLSMPSGESGEIGSPHYDDLRAAWIRGNLRPLPFSDAAVRRAARQTLWLEQ